MTHDDSDMQAPEWREEPLDYVAGALTDDERKAFERRLESGDTAAREEVEGWAGVVDLLADDCPPIAPSLGVRDRLMARIAGRPTEGGAGDAKPLFVQRRSEAKWQALDVPGVEIRTLYEDHASGMRSFLVRMAPGARFPSHAHEKPEECYVIEGDFISDDLVMHAGDYQRNPAGSVHGVTSTVGGCVLLVTAAA